MYSTPITLLYFIPFILILSMILVIISKIISISAPDSEKLSTFECGFSSSPATRSQFEIKFYLTAVLLIVMDCEVIFMFPLSYNLYNQSIFGYWIGIIFLLVLTIGFVYELLTRALKFHKS